MLNRRHLRIKVLQILYAFSQREEDDFLWVRNEILKSVRKMYELYILYLLIFPEIKKKAEGRIDANQKKMFPTETDLNPNMKFVNNKLIQIIEQQAELRHQSETLLANWVGDVKQELIRKIFLQIEASEVYFEFMNNGKEGFEEDKTFLTHLFKAEIANSSLLLDYFDDKEIYWQDDIDLTCSMVLKTLKSFSEEFNNSIMPMFKPNDDEKDFILRLGRETISRRENNLKIIGEFADNWELERIAKMDGLIMEMAITELIIFNNIPTKVTLNEYIEISKFYSTPNSSTFINGILDKAIERLKKSGEIKKVGRGLMK